MSQQTDARRDDLEIKLVDLRQLRLERVVLVGVAMAGSLVAAERSLEELRRLAETAGAEVLDAVLQRRDRPDASTFIGKGKATEIAELVQALGADTVVMDDELSPGQLRRLEELFDVKVIDRAALILDIFAQHARSREGKAQVELAQLNYLLPRLRGWGESLTRLGAGIGTRGPGETKMEVDRRRIRRRITKLRRDLEEMRAHARSSGAGASAAAWRPWPWRATRTPASGRCSTALPTPVCVEDRLFSTLDPTTRRLELPDGRPATLTDTVGFIAKLPHELVEAFKSTLEEVALADLIVHLVDASGEDHGDQIRAVREVLGEVGAAGVPELLVFNKIDLADELVRARLRRTHPEAPQISSVTGEGVGDLLEAVARRLPRARTSLRVLLPFSRGDLVDRAHREGEVLAAEHRARWRGPRTARARGSGGGAGALRGARRGGGPRAGPAR